MSAVIARAMNARAEISVRAFFYERGKGQIPTITVIAVIVGVCGRTRNRTLVSCV